jgi:GT2 family glycosyltransferase
MVRRSILEGLDLLDDSFFMYGEEKDLCFRMKKNGWGVYFFPDAEVIHLKGASSRQEVTEIINRTVSFMLFYRKHSTLLIYATMRLIFIFESTLKHCFYTALGRIPERRSQAGRLKALCKMAYETASG